MNKPSDHPQDETALIARIRSHLAGAAPPEKVEDVLVGIGDDAAAIKTCDGVSLHTTDALVEGRHFSLRECTPFELGWKSIAVNQSDIAAMGGIPVSALVTLGIRPDYTGDWIDGLCQGMAAALSRFGGVCVGGDTVTSDTTFVSIAMTGTTTNAAILKRDNARPSHLIGVTGELGAAAGWLTTRNNQLRERHFKPVPRVEQGAALASLGVDCAIDISDGLVMDLERIATSSNVDATIHSAKIPVSKELLQAAPRDALQLALCGGEDYELLFTCPPDTMRQAAKTLDCNVTVIGEIGEMSSSTPRVAVLDDAGRAIDIERSGWDPFADRSNEH